MRTGPACRACAVCAGTIATMQIGRHSIDAPVILAPMAGVTDKPFRVLCKRLGAGLAVSEMTTSRSALLAYLEVRCIAWTTAANPTRSACRSPVPCPR